LARLSTMVLCQCVDFTVTGLQTPKHPYAWQTVFVQVEWVKGVIV
jgi:hypothetical protein